MESADAPADELDAQHDSFPDWWLRDEYRVPGSDTSNQHGEFDMNVLRERFDDIVLEATDDE